MPSTTSNRPWSAASRLWRHRLGLAVSGTVVLQEAVGVQIPHHAAVRGADHVHAGGAHEPAPRLLEIPRVVEGEASPDRLVRLRDRFLGSSGFQTLGHLRLPSQAVCHGRISAAPPSDTFTHEPGNDDRMYSVRAALVRGPASPNPTRRDSSYRIRGRLARPRGHPAHIPHSGARAPGSRHQADITSPRSCIRWEL